MSGRTIDDSYVTTPALVQFLARSGADRLATEFAAAGLDGLRPLHAPLLIWLLGGGRRAAALAEGLHVSRQAIAQVVATLEAGGYVERLPDPADRRAKLICLTRRGRAAVRLVRATALATERDWEARLGARTLAEFRETLTILLDQ